VLQKRWIRRKRKTCAADQAGEENRVRRETDPPREKGRRRSQKGGKPERMDRGFIKENGRKPLKPNQSKKQNSPKKAKGSSRKKRNEQSKRQNIMGTTEKGEKLNPP